VTRSFVSVGSNLGDRKSYLTNAVIALSRSPNVQVSKVSSIYRTEPLEVGDQPEFLNAVIEIETGLSPWELLSLLQRIEQENGRTRIVRYGPRTLDMDIILFGDEVISEPALTIPHPRMLERRFVLEPLLEIAPEVTLPDGRKLSDIACFLPESPYVQKVGKGEWI